MGFTGMVWCSEKERSGEAAQLVVFWDGCPGSGAITGLVIVHLL